MKKTKRVKRFLLKEQCGPININGIAHNSIDIDHMHKQHRVKVTVEHLDDGLLVEWTGKDGKGDHSFEPITNCKNIKFYEETTTK